MIATNGQFPFTVVCDNDEPLWSVLEQRRYLRKRLLQSGAILLRGFSPESALGFGDFASRFSESNLLSYRGGASPRVEIAQGVYTSTEYPSSYQLSLHNEMSYTYRWPRLLFFYCVQPAMTGGRTPIADSRSLLKRINRAVVDEFKSKRIMYVRYLNDFAGSGYSWQDAFETQKRNVIEDYCRNGQVECKWTDDNGLTLTETRPATALHPDTHEEVWFNQADSFNSVVDGKVRLRAMFADGSALPPKALTLIRAAMRDEMISVDWQAGDLLILDNMLVAHGREPYSGSRRVLLAMT